MHNKNIMKICYIISTCDANLKTRVKYQLSSVLKYVKKEDIYYLTSQPNVEERQFGWYSMDDKVNLTWKYIHFIHKMDITDYDWYVFIEDDTFVFNNRVERFLNNYDSNENYYIGNQMNYHTNDKKCTYMSGGSGFIVSKNLYSVIHEQIKTVGTNNSYKHEKPDICFGLWIQDINNNNHVKQVNNSNFYPQLHNNDTEIENAITFHKAREQEHFDFYTFFLDKQQDKIVNVTTNETNINSSLMIKTVFVLVTDEGYFNKAKRTIIDLRSRGNWRGDIVLITINFNLNSNFKDYYDIIEKKFDIIDKTQLLDKIGLGGFTDAMVDKREITKMYQWEKLHAFDDYFKRWQRVVFLDAGLRVFDDVKNVLDLDYKNKILAQKDGKLDNYLLFSTQITKDKPELIETIKNDFGNNVLDSHFMLNCMWVYDTNILNICNKAQLIEAMNKYTCCKSNEMAIMNLMFHFKYKLWEPFPAKTPNNKFLFDWSELNQEYHTTWRDYCFIKYPYSINFDDM